jgi:hypothetical protein
VEGQRLAASLSDHQDIAREVLDKLPGPVHLDGPAFQVTVPANQIQKDPELLFSGVESGLGEK